MIGVWKKIRKAGGKGEMHIGVLYSNIIQQKKNQPLTAFLTLLYRSTLSSLPVVY